MYRALLILLALASTAVAESGPPAISGGVQLVRSDGAWRYQIVSAPRLARQIGVVTVSGLDVAAGRSTTTAEILGEDFAPPPAWPYDVDHVQRASGPLKPKPGADARIAAMFALTTFTLTPEHSGLRVIE